MRILQGLLALAGLGVVAWVFLTTWDAVVHGHPAYAVLLGLTALGCLVLLWWSFRPRAAVPRWRTALALVGCLLLAGWLAGLAWLRPFVAVEPALSAMASTATVIVTESPTGIVMVPGLDPSATGIVFQPGARVDARAYVAILRPLVDAGYTVVIPKQPLGIAFLATGAFESARDSHPEITQWVVGGHSLGGTVAAIDAEDHQFDAGGTVSALLLYGSYPASDMSTSLSTAVLSVSGTLDGLATPADIEASRADLPAEASFVPVVGAVHAFFGDYGPQPGDGTPTISHDDARAQIGQVSLDFVSSLVPR